MQGSEELFSVDPLQSNFGHTQRDNERLSTSDVAHIIIEGLDDGTNSSRNASDSRIRVSGFAPSHDDGGETEGDQDGEEGMDDGGKYHYTIYTIICMHLWRYHIASVTTGFNKPIAILTTL